MAGLGQLVYMFGFIHNSSGSVDYICIAQKHFSALINPTHCYI